MTTSRTDFLYRILEIDPTSVGALTELGWARGNDDHDYDGAVTALTKALSIERGSVDIGYRLASVHYHSGHLEHARETLEQVLGASPGHPASASLFASVCCDLKNEERAIAHLDQAVMAEPSWISLHSGLDMIHSSLGNLLLAITHAKDGFRLAKQFHEVSTAETYSYWEACVTHRWVDNDSLLRLRQRASRKR